MLVYRDIEACDIDAVHLVSFAFKNASESVTILQRLFMSQGFAIFFLFINVFEVMTSLVRKTGKVHFVGNFS